MISSKPNQNTGIEIPIRANIIVKLSNILYCFTADMIPIGIPSKTANVIAKNASLIVAPALLPISCTTGILVL